MIVFSVESSSNVFSTLCCIFSAYSLDNWGLYAPVYLNQIAFIRGSKEGGSCLLRREQKSSETHFSRTIVSEQIDDEVRTPCGIRSLLKHVFGSVSCVPNADGAILRARDEVSHLALARVPPVDIEVWWHKLDIVNVHLVRTMNRTCHQVLHSYYLLLSFIFFLIRHH